MSEDGSSESLDEVPSEGRVSAHIGGKSKFEIARRQRRGVLVMSLLVVTAACAVIWWPREVVLPLRPRLPSWPRTTANQRTPDRLRVLFLGNSFTQYNGGQALILQQLAEATGKNPLPILDQLAIGGATLEELWDTSAAPDLIRQGNWDYIVLQDHSEAALQWRPGMSRYARRFSTLARSVGARPMFFMTWARRDEPFNQPVITRAYTDLAMENNAILAPVGLAWQYAIQHRPALGLHLTSDNKHPTAAGSYLTACVFYSILFHENPHGLIHKIEEAGHVWIDLSDDDANYLQDVAWRTVSAAGAIASTQPDAAARP